MKIFDNISGWSSKVNFVDDNNVLVGFDMSQCCCENADWFLDDSVQDESKHADHEHEDRDMPGWQFDTSFFKEVQEGYFDGGGMVIFRLVNGEQEKFLHLFNHHNGYYSHGFSMEVGGQTIQEGSV